MKRFSLRTALTCGCLLHALLTVEIAFGELTRSYIENPDALCNDFTKAIYYIEPLATNSWVVYFEGGGGCSSFDDCNERWHEEPHNPLMSTFSYPVNLTGAGILSNVLRENPVFYSFSHVVVPYCSSDAWLANRTNPTRDSLQFNFAPGEDNFVFKGRVIFQSVIDEVLRYANGTLDNLVIAGSSAGGIGVINNLAWVQQRVRNTSSPTAKVAAILDSSWFVSYNGYHVINWSMDTTLAFNLPETCNRLNFGVPCCTSPACLFASELLENDLPPVFAISSIYDLFILQDALLDTVRRDGYRSDQSILRLFNGYGAVINESISQSYYFSRKLSVFTLSCTQHLYMATSSLWAPGGLLNMTQNASFQEDIFQVTNPISPDIWTTVSAPATSDNVTRTLRDAILIWFTNSSVQEYYGHNCNSPLCGECPNDVQILPIANLWIASLNLVILVVAGVMTMLPVLFKLSLYCHMKYMLYRQKLFAYSVKQATKVKPRFPKAVHAVSVSCSGLTYRIDSVKKPSTATESLPNVESTSEEEYQRYAKIETMAPHLAKCCSCCFNFSKKREVAPQHVLVNKQISATNLNNFGNGRLTPLRDDSGMASSVASRQNVTTPDSDTSNDLLETNTLVNGPRSGRLELRQRGRERRKSRITILNHVNMYINPGELVAIMGPSGSGKTTLLDVLLGRRSAGTVDGEIFINGIPLRKMRDWFVVNTGYVRQLVTSYYNELTVRENLLFSMNMQALPGMTLVQKLERVEQVIRETGLLEQGDLRVGDGKGLGLSGGQRKRLAIAVQLLSMPNIIFLDEPTSGLDSASSLEILKRLQVMAGTGRAIVVTIHQPRSEIFHAFDKILLLCKGQVAFFGSPVRVWEFFRKALISEKNLDETEGQVQDAVLDLLKEKNSQRQVLNAYRESEEPKKVNSAVLQSKDETDITPPPLYSRYPGFWNRLVSLESRASLRQTLFSVIYLPLVYTIFGTILGTTYLYTDEAAQILSVSCLLACSSSLFMSSIILSLLVEPLKLFRLEHSDGIANAHELVLQVFIRMSGICAFPLAICQSLVFALVLQVHDVTSFFILLLTFLLVNQAWIAIFIVIVVTYANQAHRLCPVFAAAGGYCCGFIIPKPLMPPYYQWIFNINPSYYAFSASAVVILEDDNLSCSRDSPLECFRDSGVATLDYFGLADVNPFMQMVIMMGMIVILVILAIAILQFKVMIPLITEKLKRLCCAFRRNRKRIRSAELGLTRVSSDAALLTDISRKGSKFCRDETDSPHVTARNGLPKIRINSDDKLATAAEVPSSSFLEQGNHEVHHTFPWDRPQESEMVDSGDGMGGLTPVALMSPRVRFSRMVSEAGGGGGEDGIMSPTSEVINMEDEDEENRKLVANFKWNLRKQKIENEFLRLRHFSINREKAARQRHSVSLGGDLEDEITGTSGSFRETPKRRGCVSTSDTSYYHNNVMRSTSMPHNTAQDSLHRLGLPTLETYIEEEDYDDDVMMELPPKDVPHSFGSMEDLEDFDVNDMPEAAVPVGEWDQQKTNGKDEVD